MKTIASWIQKNRTEFWILFAILAIAAVLRLWRIDEYLPFLGDEGRDVRVVRRFLTDFDLMFIGPRTSIGDMYLGPAYYYLIAPFLLLFNFSPTGPAIFVALLSVATVFLVWLVAREWFGKLAAFSAAILYAVSPSIINFSKHSWNPNIMPFFALLAVWSVWQVWKHGRLKWLVVLGVSLAIILQSHYLGLLLFPVIGLYWVLSFIRYKRIQQSPFLKFSILGVLVFAFIMSPLALFDSKHEWLNFNSMKRFFFERQETVSAKPWSALPFLEPFWREHIVKGFLTAGNTFGERFGIAFVIGVFVVWVGYSWRKTKDSRFSPYILLILWLLVGVVGLGLLKQNIYQHYFGFLFPIPFFLVGAVVQGLTQKHLKIVGFLLLAFLLWVNLENNPLKNSPQRQMDRVREIDKQIVEDSRGAPFNFGLIAERNYEEGYLYFFELSGAPVREIDPSNTDKTLTDQLYVVCEDPICEPINHRKAEIANFGWAKIEKQWETRGFKIFKLVHTSNE